MLAIVLLEALRFSKVSQISLSILWDGLVLLRGDPLVRGLLLLSQHVAR